MIMRKVIRLNDDWLFAKTSEVPQTKLEQWDAVILPHTWNAADGQDGGNDYWRGTAMYCRELERPDVGDGRMILEIPGAAMSADVYLNGKHLIHHDGGYSAFRVDLTEEFRGDTALLGIAVDNGENDRVYPQKADFTFYGGLYRGVNLILVPEKHFELCKDGTPGIKVTPQVNAEAGKANVRVETWQTGDGEVEITVDGRKQSVPSVDGYACAEFEIEDVRLWDGTKDPYLYTAAAVYGEDEISARFGCRTIAFDPEKGFLLNGKVTPLRGVSRHQDRQGIGNALSVKEHREDMELIREIGANTVRLAHYQHAQEFYDLCDEYGMAVWAEIPYITEHMPGGRQNTLDQMRELITQCYNHPSIVCWGLSNEVAVHGVSDDLIENHVLLNDMCHRMDGTRPTTMAHAFMLEHESPLIRIPDIGSYNLYFGWYMGTLEQNDSFFDEYHRKYPDRVMGFSEYGADANVRFQSPSPEQGDYSEQYQCRYHEYILGCIDRHPWMWATHVWNMFDFAADGRDEGGAHGLNQKGIVSFDRKLKKDAYYLYKAAWNKETPFVHLCGRRYEDRTEKETEIRVYSNQTEVELYQDGRPIGKKTGNRVFAFRAKLTGEHVFEAKAGNCIDSMTIRKVEREHAGYCFGERKAVANWFDESDFRSDCYSVRDSFGVLMSHPEAGQLVGAMMKKMVESRGDAAKSAHGNPNLQKMLAGMSFESLIKQAGDAVSGEEARELNRRLQQITK